jgi:hypothetical protein
MPLIPALRRLKQDDQKTDWAAQHDPLSKKKRGKISTNILEMTDSNQIISIRL